MKRFTLQLFCLLAFALVCNLPSFAQQNTSDSDKATVMQKITSEDGTVTVKKKRLEKGQALQSYLDALGLKEEDGQSVEVTIIQDGKEKQLIQGEEGETILFIRSGKEKRHITLGSMTEMKEMEEKLQEMSDKLEDMDIDVDFEYDGEKYKYNYNYNYNYNYSYDHSDNPDIRADRPLLGIYPSYSDEGVVVDGLVNEGGAVKAGLKEGDIITALNGNEIMSETDLVTELSKYEPGQSIGVTYIRDGQIRNTQSTLTERNNNNTRYRDPCKVFIGVTLGNTRVSGIISNTAAAEMDLERGDEIIEMDGVAVSTFNELLTERNKHEPGDYFVLTVLRDGVREIVEGQFKECPEEEEELTLEEPVLEEVIEPTPEIDNPTNTLIFEELKAFPNPTFGNLNIVFEGEAVPTIFRVTDSTGKVIFSDQVNNFNGSYNRQISVSKGVPGNLYLTVQQNQHLVTRQIVLMPRA